METKRTRVLLSDVDGTIIAEEGGNTSKGLALKKLLPVIDGTLEFLCGIGALTPAESGEAKEAFAAYGHRAMETPAHFGRLFGSPDEARAANPEQRLYVIFEAMKADSKNLKTKTLIGLIEPLIVGGIATGEFPVTAHQDLVYAYEAAIVGGDFRLATYSGGSVGIQSAMLSKVELMGMMKDRAGAPIKTLANLIDESGYGAGMHDVKAFGQKEKVASYEAAAKYFQERGLTIAYYITDGISEAEAAQSAGLPAVLFKKTSFPGRDALQDKGIRIIGEGAQFAMIAMPGLNPVY